MWLREQLIMQNKKIYAAYIKRPLDILLSGFSLIILILTIKKVFLKEGISSTNNITNEKFKGNE